MRIHALLTAGLITVAAAAGGDWPWPWHKPVGDPKGNPITRPLNEAIPKGKPFTIRWTPTTPLNDRVTLVLLKGPSTNVIPQFAIAQKIKNTGHYVWTPPQNLELSDPSTPDQGYGIQLIVEKNGQYQYSTQFGIKKGPHHNDIQIAEAPDYTTEVVAGYTTYCSEPTTVSIGSSTYTVTKPTTISVSGPCTITHPITTTSHSYPTYTPPSNGTYTHHNYTFTHSTYKPTTHKTTDVPTHSTSTSTYVPPTMSHSVPTPTDNAAVKLGMSFIGAAGLVVAAMGL